MRESGRILGIILGEIEKMVKPGMTTLEIDQYAEKTYA
jgi:methionine aminopeptidase